MRDDTAGVALSAEQARAAAEGRKAMMPVGRPFLDYVLSALADAGARDVCIVVAPGDDAIRERYTTGVAFSRLSVQFAEQAVPRGTADAVSAARAFIGDSPFIVLNADNYYPVTVLQRLIVLGMPGLAAFDADALMRLGNMPEGRVRAYALVRTDANGELIDIIEKPDDAAWRAIGRHARVSMNLWSFPPEILVACDRVAPSARGELELPDAVRLAMHDLGVRFRAVACDDGVLDLSSRADVPAVAARLRGVEVRL
jgi:dTDP-glucose pyrophosphorylase